MVQRRKLPDGMIRREGRKGYYCDFTVSGRRVRRFLSTDFKAACQILNDLKARADKADFGLMDNNYPLANLRRDWLTYCRQVLKPRTVECYENWLRNVFAYIKVPKVSQLTTSLILDYREHRLAADKSPRTINGEVQCLRNMLNWAVEKGIIGNNPIKSIDLLPHRKPKQGRALTSQEVKRLLKVSPQHWRNVWYFMVTTGVRLNEMVNLKFSDVDFEKREIVIRAEVSKNHTERRIPVNDQLFETLRRLANEREDRKPGDKYSQTDRERIRAKFSRDHVFVTGQNTPHNNRRNVYRAFIRLCEQAGIKSKTFNNQGELLTHVDVHSLRRTFATDLITNGVDPNTVRKLLGHKTLRMTMSIYAQVQSQNKHAAIAKLSYGGEVCDRDSRQELALSGASHQSDTTSKI